MGKHNIRKLMELSDEGKEVFDNIGVPQSDILPCIIQQAAMYLYTIDEIDLKRPPKFWKE